MSLQGNSPSQVNQFILPHYTGSQSPFLITIPNTRHIPESIAILVLAGNGKPRNRNVFSPLSQIITACCNEDQDAK